MVQARGRVAYATYGSATASGAATVDAGVPHVGRHGSLAGGLRVGGQRPTLWFAERRQRAARNREQESEGSQPLVRQRRHPAEVPYTAQAAQEERRSDALDNINLEGGTAMPGAGSIPAVARPPSGATER